MFDCQHMQDAIQEFKDMRIPAKDYTFTREKYTTRININHEYDGKKFLREIHSKLGSSDWVYVYCFEKWTYVLSVDQGRLYVGLEAYEDDNQIASFEPFMQGDDIDETIVTLLDECEYDTLAWYMAETYCY